LSASLKKYSGVIHPQLSMKKYIFFVFCVALFTLLMYTGLSYFLHGSYATSIHTESKTGKPEQSRKPALFKVLHIVDGDTITIEHDGKKETIRLLGINTPESVAPMRPKECYGKEASNFLKNILESTYIDIEYDIHRKTVDIYGRTLAYIILDGKNINQKMIEEGYAFEYTYHKEIYTHQGDFRAAQKRAKERGLGLWSTTTCNGELRPI
jgi:endonuclease YncB( thermonuclease family)